jgi:hypothetical protein
MIRTGEGYKMKTTMYGLLLIFCISFSVISGYAQVMEIPGDINGDKIVSTEEVTAAEKWSKKASSLPSN